MLLKSAGVPPDDMVRFYCTTISPVLEYCVQVYHHSLHSYLSDDVERVQWKAMSSICHGLSYSECLARFGLDILKDRRSDLCLKLFDTISRPSNLIDFIAFCHLGTARHTQDVSAHITYRACAHLSQQCSPSS